MRCSSIPFENAKQQDSKTQLQGTINYEKGTAASSTTTAPAATAATKLAA